MAERLGEALLEIRTLDAGFTQDVAQAKGRAAELGATLDRTKGSSAQLAGEMAATGRSAAQMGAGFEQAGRQVTQSASQQRAGMQQLSFQLGDIATMYALGARPMQIFASQSGQVIQSIQMMTGGTSRLAAILGGPWGIALTSAAVVLSPFIGKLFEAEDALQSVEFASDKMGEAQGILGSVINATTGQINAQSQALIVLARAQAAAGRVGAITRQAEAGRQLDTIRRGEMSFFGPGGFTRPTRTGDGTQDIVSDFRSGRIAASFAIGSLESRMKAGMIDQQAFLRAAQAITNFEVEGANVKVFEDLQRALNGDAGAARGIMGPPTAPRARGRTGGGARGPDQAEIDARAESQLIQITQAILRARMQTATSAEERAELAARAVEWDHRTQQAEIEGDTRLSEAQKKELADATTRLRDAELDAINFAARVEANRDALALAQERGRGELEALQNAAALADTEAERKAIALRLLEAEERLERLRLSTIIAAEETDAATRAQAEAALANLDANSAGRRAATARQNETEAERYVRDLNKTPAMINEALDGIRIDGLEALNDGLTRAIMGAESLGDVFSRVADQIIADLLRIAIQQAIIRPLANALFGGFGGLLGGSSGGSGGSGQLGVLMGKFVGGRASGGMIPTGTFAVVGEEGPELAFAGPGGLGILSNPQSRALMSNAGGGTSVSIPITIDATGADSAAIARLNAQLEQLQADLPGRIINTVREAGQRRFLSIGGGR